MGFGKVFQLHGRAEHPSGVGTPAEMLGWGPRSAPPETPHARATIQPGAYPLFPGRDFDRLQPILRPIEITDAAEIRRAFQLTFERVCPTMIRAAHLRRSPFRFGHHGRRVVAADVEEAP